VEWRKLRIQGTESKAEDFNYKQFCGRSGEMPTPKPSDRYHSLEIQAKKTIREHNMLNAGEHVLVGVSGGADSTALLFCLKRLAPELGLSLSVAHLNHGIRGAESDEDEVFVRQISDQLGLQFFSEIIDVKQQAAAAGQNMEELARRIRYDFLRRTARRIGAQKIAVGHNLNDQAETALFRFIRGSGLKGLASIYPVLDGWIIRPLLDCSGNSIREYLKNKTVAYREDSSNRDLRYARNRIRRELVPYLENHFNARLTHTIAHEALLARETWSFVESQAKEAFERIHIRVDGGISLQIKALIELHPALKKEVLRQALKVCLGSLRGIDATHIQNILDLSDREGNRQVQIPRGGLVIRQSDRLVMLRSEPERNLSYVYELCVPGNCAVPEDGTLFSCRVGFAPNREVMKEKKYTQAFLDPSVLPPTLTIRSRRAGDRYGGPGHRKVKRMLINNKIPRLQRSVLPMLTAGDHVIWIPGFRPARGYEAKPDSADCVVIERMEKSNF
jgi:tRNA(Ile)-lysidine synthase